MPGELPTPPGGQELGYGGKALKWLAREVQQGVLPDESIEEIRRNPTGPAALAAYANAAIMLSRGAGGKGPGELPKGAVPHEIWQNWDVVGGGVRRDPAGNHYKFLGDHVVEEGGQRTGHAIVQPVEAPGGTLEHLRETQNKSDDTFPSLNKPPYDALKEPEWDPVTGLSPGKKFNESGEIVPDKDPSFPAEDVQKMEDLKDFLKPHEAPKGQYWTDKLMEWQKDHPPSESSFPTFEEFYQSQPQKMSHPKAREDYEAHIEWLKRQMRGEPPPQEPPQFKPRNPDDPFDRMPGSQGFPQFKKGTRGVRHNPKTKTGRPKKIGVEKGYGPRHAANAKEGEDLTAINTDTVPAMLTPREAVLNRNAAELAGREDIEALNEQGNELAQQGIDLAGKDKDMKPKAKTSKPKPQSGSPYAQGYEKLQGGGPVNNPFPGRGPGGVYPPALGGASGQLGTGAPPAVLGGDPGLQGLQTPQPGLDWQHKRNMAPQGPGLDWQRKRNAAINAGQDQPALPPGAVRWRAFHRAAGELGESAPDGAIC